MIAYLDASALVKLYVEEPGSAEVKALLGRARAAGTGVLSRAEVVAALARAARVGLIPREAGMKAVKSFAGDWEQLVRIQIGEALAARAATLAWEHGLRGYDAVHLATALAWRETLGEAVTVATYDRELWRGAQEAGLLSWPTA